MEGNDRTIAGFTMVGHASFHVYEMTIPLFVVVWLDVFDVSPAVLGTIVAVGYGLVGVGAIPSGVLADRYGSKRLVIASMLGMAGGFVLVALSPTEWLLALALVVWGAAASLYHPAGLSLITRSASRRGTVLAYHGVAGNLGIALGPLVAVVLLTVFEWRTVALLLTVPALAGVAFATRLEFEETDFDAERSSVDAREALSRFLDQSKLLFVPGFLAVFTIAMLAGTYYRGLFTFLPEVLADLPVFGAVVVGDLTLDSSQYAFAGLLLVGAAGQYLGGRLSDSSSPERVIAVTFVALVAVTLVFPFVAGAGLAATAAIGALLGFFVFMEAPVHQALIGKYAPAEIHGLSFGYTYLGVFGIGAAGSSIAGVAITVGGTQLLFAVLAVFPAVGLVLAGYLLWR